MGSEVARQNDAVVESNAPSRGSGLDVDLADPADVRSVFGSGTGRDDTSTKDVLTGGTAVDNTLSTGLAADTLKPNGGNPLLPDVALVDGRITSGLPEMKLVENGRDVTGAQAQPEVVTPGGDVTPPAAPQLKENTLEAAKIRRKEGYFQVANRLLGDGFSSDDKRALTTAMKDAWKANPANGNPDQLKRGDALLTQQNMDTVLNSIQDAGLRERMRERLMSAEFPPSGEAPRRERNERRREGDQTPPPQREQRRDQGRRPDVNPEPEPRPREEERRPTPEGEFKSPFLRQYNEGDKFKGLTSVYWQGRQTASGLPFDRYEMTAASKEFPFGTILKVTNPSNGKEVRVVITDHGPFAGEKVQRPDGSGRTHSRVLDISLGAANALGMGKTVKPLEIAVESIPPEGKWGGARRNIHGDYKARVRQDVARLSRRG